ncbi:MAG TPA: uroporphyrinogen decarboxylase family protein [bacterium]|nr:uroporphyrinogen decarboxylase family protein [bacterium]HPG46458.1 uroporphyrinogen decarboxylase family protein [bacterium]HPM98629.1 uroporphyrinogen decarboxylase family protein [bacterium]
MQFSPSVYEHAARFVPYTPWQVSRNLDLMVQAHAAAYERYRHQPITVGIDIYNLEAEAYGAQVAEPQENDIPTIATPLCDNMDAVLQLTPFDPVISGRLKLVIDAGKQLKNKYPSTDIRIPVSGPFSIASNLLGMEPLLLELAFNPQSALQALTCLADNQLVFCRAILQAGLKITFFESAATPPLVSPQQFERILLPVLQQMNEKIQAISGEPIALVMGGDTCTILPALIQIGSNYLICPSETDQQRFMEMVAAFPEIMVRINLNPRVVSYGKREEIVAEIDRIFDLAGTRQRVCLGTGVLAYDVPPENVDLIQEIVKQKSRGV